MLDHQNNPVGDPQTHYITPKTEPGLGPQYSPHHSHQMSPPPYPGSDHHSEAGTVGSDYGVDPMEEEEGRQILFIQEKISRYFGKSPILCAYLYTFLHITVVNVIVRTFEMIVMTIFICLAILGGQTWC